MLQAYRPEVKENLSCDVTATKIYQQASVGTKILCV